MFENHRKRSHCERSELRLHFEWTKVHQKCQNGPFGEILENLKLTVKQCYQTEQNLVENVKNKTVKCDI